MERVPEPELMENEAQVKAYAEADFEQPHSQFMRHLQTLVRNPGFDGVALDLGCGPCDIARRFVEAYPGSQVHALDGSKAMLDYGASSLLPALRRRIHLIHGRLPDVTLPQSSYEIIFSNSLLHHLPNPLVLWQSIKKYAGASASIGVMDLIRPDSLESAQFMVDTYADNEPPILRQDFYNSLLAAFSLEEIRQQLKAADLGFNIEQISDRHVFITGIMP